MIFKIPKSFTILGSTFKVLLVDKVDEFDSWGECYIRTIKIKKSLSLEDKETTFLHECTHAILDSLGYKELSASEPFVEQVSQIIYQIIKTSK